MILKTIKDFYSDSAVETTDKPVKIVLEHIQSKKQIKLSGKVLEAQYLHGDNYLILTTEGAPFEEGLYIYYLDNKLQILDALGLGMTYTEGFLENLQIPSPNALSFTFFNNEERWELTIAPRGSFNPFFHSFPVRRIHPFFSKRWLRLQSVSK